MSYTAESGRTQILEDMATAADQLAGALSALGEAYEQLDDQSAERVETRLFRPLQSAYGQLKRSYGEFAGRYRLSMRPLEPAPTPLPGDPRRLLEQTGDLIASADTTLGDLQDTLLPVEVGDEVLRAGLSQVRVLIAPLPTASAELVRTHGR